MSHGKGEENMVNKDIPRKECQGRLCFNIPTLHGREGHQGRANMPSASQSFFDILLSDRGRLWTRQLFDRSKI